MLTLPERSNALLEVRRLATGYGSKRVLDGVDIDASRGEIVALIGHNGAGKSTLLKAVFGLMPLWDGSVHFDGSPLAHMSPRRLLSLGIAYVPQGNRVFTDLSVRENLEIGNVHVIGKADRILQVCRLFPTLNDRLRQRAGTLSGGEKQILALAHALLASPRLLLLDEPSLGLAPRLIGDAFARIRDLADKQSVSVLVVEQKVREVLAIANRVCVLRNGCVSFSGLARDLEEESKLREVYL